MRTCIRSQNRETRTTKNDVAKMFRKLRIANYDIISIFSIFTGFKPTGGSGLKVFLNFYVSEHFFSQYSKTKNAKA